VARVLGPKLSESFGQPVVIDNRPGAGGNHAADMVAKSDPDGHTILITPNGLAISPILYRNLPFDPAKDFAAVTQLVESRQILVASGKLPVKSVKDVVALAKAKPGGLNYGNAGVGNALHLSMELFNTMAGVDIVAVPYKGAAAIELALLSKEVDLAVMPFSAGLLQNLKTGKIIPLGFTASSRSPAFPDIPTISESVPGYEMGSWHGLFVASKTPRPVVDRIYRETAKACQTADVRKYIETGGGRDIVCSTPDEFSAVFKSDIAKFARIGKAANISFQD
jgi:tripartite-type tricarboxylate transporter receptor subunit TctC